MTDPIKCDTTCTQCDIMWHDVTWYDMTTLLRHLAFHGFVFRESLHRFWSQAQPRCWKPTSCLRCMLDLWPQTTQQSLWEVRGLRWNAMNHCSIVVIAELWTKYSRSISAQMVTVHQAKPMSASVPSSNDNARTHPKSPWTALPPRKQRHHVLPLCAEPLVCRPPATALGTWSQRTSSYLPLKHTWENS